jgi:hypothetical protein
MAARLRLTPLRWEPRTGELVTYGVQGLLQWPSRHDPATRRYRLGPPQRLLAGDFWDGHLATSSDGQTIAIPGRGGGALVLDLKKPVAAAADWVSSAVRLGPQEDVRWCALSPDGRWVATGSHGDTAGFAAKVWNAAAGELVKEFAVPGFCAVAFSPDGRWLLTTGGGCRLWRVGSWREGPIVGGASGCFSPDGQLVAVDDSAGAIRLVRPESGFELARLEAPEQTRLQPAAFSPDGTRLIAVGIDTQALHVWDLGRLREQLAAIDLDWDAPAYAAADLPSAPDRRRPFVPIELELAPPGPTGCSEAENLRIVERTDCEPFVQPMDAWDRRQWSNGRQLFCPSRKGSSVTLEINVAEAGEYHLDIYFTMAPDYGVLEVRVDDQQVGNRFDGFCREVAPSGGIALGAAQLSRGKHRMLFSVVDKNPASTNHHMGIDCLELKPAKHEERKISDALRLDPSHVAAASSQ